MAGSPHGLDSSQWREVDSSPDPAFFTDYLDRAAAGLRPARQEAIQALDPRPGCSVLDVGSGVGEFLIELAGEIPGIRAVGVDSSEELVRMATARAELAGVSASFRRGDAEHLDFADGSFDRVNCSRVLQHLRDPDAAVREMARVLAAGGRLVLWEPDFDALMIDSDDLATSAAVRRRVAARLRNPDMGRRLRRLAYGAGLQVLDMTAVARGITELARAQAQFHVLDHLDAAVAAGEVSQEAAARWRAGLEAAENAGILFISPVGFRLLAAKPS